MSSDLMLAISFEVGSDVEGQRDEFRDHVGSVNVEAETLGTITS